MSYGDAENDAKRAQSAARSAAGNAEDQGVIELARSVEYLAKAVGEIARQLKMAD
jgi:hypothetical protein